jgi:hypothetical protein
VDEQLGLLAEWLEPHRGSLGSRSIHEEAIRRNGSGGYGDVEADVLFGFVATCRPQRIIQVGCGVSTAVMLQAAAQSGHRPDVVCIEPYPSAFKGE